MLDQMCSRKKFIRKCLYFGSAVLSSGLFLSGCKSKKSDQGDTEQVVSRDSCNDLSGVSENEIEKRKKFGYVMESPIPDSHCSNCNLYIPPGADKECGGCMLFKGPVCASGYCTYWAPQT